MCEVSQDKLDLGLSNIEGNWKRSSAFKSGKLSEAQLKARMQLISTSTAPDYKDLAECDAVIEAAFESLAVKKEIFSKLDKACKRDALLCTNTSYLDVDEIAKATSRPEQVIGTHFFSPANVMPLLENVRGKRTSGAAIATAMKMGKDIGKTAVLARNAFGFIGNRMFEPYTQQAICMLEEGATPSQVDAPLGPAGFGFAMGPLAVFDLAGNDIGQRIRRESYYPFKADQVKGARGKSWMALADELCDKGRLGQKTGKGWFSYEDKRKAVEDPLVVDMAKAHAKKFGIAPRHVTPQEVVERCVFSLVNEGFRILEEGVAVRSSDIDVVWNYGYGFPRYRGGPMHYADHVIGLANVRKALLKHLETQPQLPEWHFKPAPLLEKLVKEGKTLKQYESGKGK
jgi:3-hydroxyacyl-CoA dehydrogenase